MGIQEIVVGRPRFHRLARSVISHMTISVDIHT